MMCDAHLLLVVMLAMVCKLLGSLVPDCLPLFTAVPGGGRL